MTVEHCAPTPYLGGPVAWEGGPDHVPEWVKQQGRRMREHDARCAPGSGKPLTFVDMWPGLDAATRTRIRQDYWDDEAGGWKPGTPITVREDHPPGTLLEA